MSYREPGIALTKSIVVDFGSAVPLYRQIADGMRALIARGALAEGDELPSVRKLGGMLGVNLNTVAKAYRTLADENTVELRKGSPARVLTPPTTTTDEPIDADVKRRISEVVGRMRLAGASRTEVRAAFEEALDRFYGTEEEGEN